MKNKTCLLFCLFSVLLICQSKATDFVTLVSPGAGQLQLSDEALTAVNLRVKGHIDARDFKTLKTVTINRTRVLDLSEAVIDAYTGKGGCYVYLSSNMFVGTIPDIVCEANVFPDHAFCEERDNSLSKKRAGSTTLRRLILPETLVGISSDAFYDCKMLTELVTTDNSKLTTVDDAVVYTKDKTRLVKVAPGYVGNLNLPETVSVIDSCALKDVKLSCIRINSDRIPNVKGASLVDAAYILSDSADVCRAIFSGIDCVEKIENIVIDNVTEGTLLEAIGNKGYKRDDVRSVTVSGVLNASDINSLFALPNLYYADLSSVTTTTTSISLSGSKLCEIKFPKGNYSLSISNNYYLGCDLIVPEGVYGFSCSGTPFASAVFPSTLKSVSESSFKSCVIRRADFSACTNLTKLKSVFNSCGNLKELLLPPSLEILSGVTKTPIESIELPNTLKTWSSCTDWDIETITLPAALSEMNYIEYMPRLKFVNADNAGQLKTLSNVFDGCPLIESLDLSNSPVEEFKGFNAKSSSSVVVMGGTRHPAPDGTLKLNDVKMSSTVKSVNGFNDCPNLADLNFEHCYRLTSLNGVENCPKLETLSLPSELSSFACTLKGCENLKTIRTAALTPPVIASGYDSTQISKITLYVPDGKVGLYNMSDGWSYCNETKNGGYSVRISLTDDNVYLIDGAGLYTAGTTVTLSSKSTYIDEIQQKVVNVWRIGDDFLNGETVSFVPEGNSTVLPSALSLIVDWNSADVYFEFEALKDTVHQIALHQTGSVTIYSDYSENAVIYNSDSYGYCTIDLSLGKGIHKFAVVGDFVSLDMNSAYNYEHTNVLKRFVLNNKEQMMQLYLSYLDCDSVDVSDCPNLRYLGVNGNNLVDLDLSGCSSLGYVYAYNNRLQKIDLSDSKATLSYIDVSNNELIELDLSGCSSLGYVYADNNRLQKIDLSDSKATLNYINVSNNELVELDLSGCSSLTQFYAYNNRLQKIDLSDSKTTLSRINVSNNELIDFDLSGCSSLISINAIRNKLQNINLDDCLMLKSIYVNDNNLTSLSLSSDSISNISWYGNYMTFSFLTPELYNALTSYWNTSVSFSFKVSEETINETGYLDLSHDLYASEYAKGTVFKFLYNGYQEYVPNEDNGKFYFDKKGEYYIEATNENFPLLKFWCNFYFDNTDGIDDTYLDGLELSVNKGSVTISGLNDEADIEIVSLDGVVICKEKCEKGEITLDVPDTEKVCLLRIKIRESIQTLKIKTN